jgi:hypothetical protein
LPVVLGAPLLIALAFIVARDEPLLLKLSILVIGACLAVFYHHQFNPLIVKNMPTSGNS